MLRRLLAVFAVTAVLLLSGCGYNTIQSQDEQVKATAYQSCIDAYVAIQKEAAREHYAAGDAAIRDYNAFVNDVNAANKKLVEKIDKQAKDSN